MNTTSLERLAGQAAVRPFFLGCRLAEFAAREALDDTALAARLGCDVPALTHIRLCRAPRLESSAAFREDVTCIATKFGLNAAALAEAAKPVPIAVKRDPLTAEPTGAVLAARDRDAAP
jgi:hypothetical protein